MMNRWMAPLLAALVLGLTLTLSLASPAAAQVALVQSDFETTDTFASDGTIVNTLPFNCTVGNLLVVVIGSDFINTTYATTDGGGNTYADAVSVFAGGEFDGNIKYARCGTATNTITTVAAGGATFGIDRVVVYEFSGVTNPVSLTGTPSSNTTSGATTHDTGNVTTASTHSVLVGGAICSGGTYSPDADFDATNDHIWGNGLVAYKILSMTGTHSMTITSSAPETCGLMLAAFEGSGGGGGPAPRHRLLLLGVGE